MERRALIFGVTGQDGSYLAEQLLEDGYEVVGVVRRTSTNNRFRIAHLSKLILVAGDVTDAHSVSRIISYYQPTEVYNLAAQSHVGTSFFEPSHTFDVVYRGCLNCLEAIRSLRGFEPRYYQASSSEMFGSMASLERWAGDFRLVRHVDLSAYKDHPEAVAGAFQDEETPMRPNSPYAAAKLAAHHLCRIYRESYGVFACSGVLYNHESPRRGLDFVTRKITHYLGRLRRGEAEEPLRLGNLEARRDWGHAADYVRGMRLMLRHDRPDDYVLATGRSCTVGAFLAAAFAEAGAQVEGNVEIDPALFRPCEVPHLRGCAAKAEAILGWKPQKSFHDLVREMVAADGGR